jgi:hypothetical protein
VSRLQRSLQLISNVTEAAARAANNIKHSNSAHLANYTGVATSASKDSNPHQVFVEIVVRKSVPRTEGSSQASTMPTRNFKYYTR